MKYIADLHVHSKYSRATAKNLDLVHLYQAAMYKGITVVGTGDFTHPAWIGEIEEKLTPAEPGMFKLREAFRKPVDNGMPDRLKTPVRFILQTEISSIYKKGEKVRKNHNLLFFPDIDKVKAFNRRLDKIGNINSDGRPIIGLPADKLLALMLEVSEEGFLIPAHIWTPWFSLFGSKSGFDTIAECFGDLSSCIFAAETGLSSDPPMNWRVEDLDNVRLISSSDAHSPMYLGRNATVFTTDLSFYGIRDALESGDPGKYGGTLDMFPHQGKYHYDGHRKCNVCLNPAESIRLNNLCPVCGRPLTLGVLNRVEQLAERPQGYKPENRQGFQYIIPLADLFAEIFEVGPKTKRVRENYNKAVGMLGGELGILLETPLADIERVNIPLFAEAVKRMRADNITVSPGFDGEYGKVKIFEPEERRALKGATRVLFPSEQSKIKESPPRAYDPYSGDIRERKEPAAEKGKFHDARDGTDQQTGTSLNAEQQAAVMHTGSPLIVEAGPGTGKTRTLTEKIAWLIREKKADPASVLALTFTNKAAGEMAHRIKGILGDPAVSVYTATFHAFCLMALKTYAGFDGEIATDEIREKLIKEAASGSDIKPGRLDMKIQKAKQNLSGLGDAGEPDFDTASDPAFRAAWERYDAFLAERNLLDYEDVINRTVAAFQADSRLLSKVRARFGYIFVDEYQDINKAQYSLIRLMAGNGDNLTVIGDPDQSIYGFRGSDNRYFGRFMQDYPRAEKITFKRNYRSIQTILDASFQLISSADRAREKEKLFSGLAGGAKLVILERATEKAEAVAVGKMIEQLAGGTSFFSMDSGAVAASSKKEFSFADFAVLFRTKRQSAVFETVFQTAGIPYQCARKETSVRGKGEDLFSHDQDFLDPDAEKVSLMTVHASKGLEFPVVFVTGCEEGLIPFARKDEPVADLQEEKRLFYVAMTRAQDVLCLTYAKKRVIFGRSEVRKKSPFLSEIEETLKEYRKAETKKKKNSRAERQMDLF